MLKKLTKIGLSLMMILGIAFSNVSLVKANETDQIQEIKNRLKTYFLELDTIDDGAKVDTCCVSKASDYLALIQDDGSFNDVDYASTQSGANGKAWDPYLALDRLQAIAIAYNKAGNSLYQKQEAVDKLELALTHWASVNPRSTNWWENQVGVQLRFSRIALFMEDVISDKSMNIMLTKLIEKTPVKYGTGQNNLWFDQNHVYYALLKKDSSKLHDMVNYYLNYCLVTQLDDNTAEAVQVDNSFYMHGRQFYSNGYGLSMFRDMSFWIYMLRNTDFALSDEVMDRMADYMINGTSWTLRGDIMELYLGYRPYSYDVGYDNYASAYIDPLKRMIASDTAHAAQYQAILDNIEGKNISNGKNGNYYMWRSGYASHMRDNYGVNIKMDSDTIIGGEWRGSTNAYGQLIYWTSSSASTITVDGDEYTNVFPVYDWAHCPGTTTPARIVQDFSNSGRFTNGTSHTIGVSNGKYGSTAYVMSKKDTQATKGYFFFDDEFVALGAGISSKESTAIHTTLNQCEAKDVQVNGTKVVQGTNQDYDDVNYIYNDKIGYVFLDDTTVHVSNEKINSANSLWDSDMQQSSSPVFKAYIDHGVKPSNDSYAYIVVPDTTEKGISTYANNISVTVVANTANVQAVRHDGLKQTQINFYKAGSLEYKDGYTVTVDEPCSILIDESGKTRKMTVAVNDQEQHQVVNVKLSYNNTQTTTSFVSQALPYAGQSMTLNEGTDSRYQASSETDEHPVTNVVDGDTNTYWQSTGNDEESIILYTGSDQFIKTMTIDWGNSYATNYDVYVSQDGKTYDHIQAVTNTTGNSDTISIGTIFRYVKIVMNKSSGSNYQIKEITFEPSQLLSKEKDVTVSSTSSKDTSNIKELAVDGNLNTRWSSNRGSNDEWIYVDLGKTATLDAVKVQWQEACSDEYVIEVSNDKETWTTVTSQLSTDSSLKDTIIFDKKVEGRYVRLHSTKTRTVNGTNYGISIYEFEVYGIYNRATENIALNKETETSSVSTFNDTSKKMVGACAVDGDKTGNSRWASLRNSDDNWITIDLGRKADIDDIMIYWEGACSSNYQIEVSNDNENWEIVKSGLVSNSDLTDKISFDESVNARYVKIHSLKSKLYKYGINIFEIEVYGVYTEEEAVETNIALNKPSYASSEYIDIKDGNKKYVSSLAFDGRTDKIDGQASRWVSNRETSDEWIYVDLEDYYDISKVVLNWEGACGKEYKIQVSTDAKNWEDISHVADGTAGIKTFTYEEGTIARYVRMQGIEPAGKYGYSLWEFEVYGNLLTKDILKLTYDQYKGKDVSAYTPASVIVYESALNNLNSLYNNENISRGKIVEAIEQFKDALNKLVEKANKTLLQELVNKINNLDKSQYTEKTWKTLESQLELAQKILENENATQEDVDKVYESLDNAMNALALKSADYSQVDEAIEKANKLNKEDYKDFSEVEKAIASVVKGLDITKQEEVDGYAKAIEEAISKLEVKEAEATEEDKKHNTDKEETKGNEVTKTGDDTNVMIYVVAFVLAISLGIILFVRRKKE